MHPAIHIQEYREPLIRNWDGTRVKQHIRIFRKFKFGEGKVTHLRIAFTLINYIITILIIGNKFIKFIFI
jgi:hypothetical protein